MHLVPFADGAIAADMVEELNLYLLSFDPSRSFRRRLSRIFSASRAASSRSVTGLSLVFGLLGRDRVRDDRDVAAGETRFFESGVFGSSVWSEDLLYACRFSDNDKPSDALFGSACRDTLSFSSSESFVVILMDTLA